MAAGMKKRKDSTAASAQSKSTSLTSSEAEQQLGAASAGAQGGLRPASFVLAASIAAATFFAVAKLIAPEMSWLPFGVAQGPAVYTFRVVRRFDHDPLAFTQGLLWANGSMYESTGLFGRSGVREVRLKKSGKATVVREVQLEQELFGEGLVHHKGELLQLLWRRPDGLRFAAVAGSEDGHLERKPGGFRTPLADGWGLESVDLAGGERVLLATDSGPELFHLDPDSFELRRKFLVTDAGRPIEMINELEMVEDELFANVFGRECLARIDPSSGEVRGWVDLTGLLDRRSSAMEAQAAGRDPPDVLNGIAWDAEKKRLFVTGKLWPALFEIEVLPHPTLTLEEARHRCIPPKNIFRAPAPSKPGK